MSDRGDEPPKDVSPAELWRGLLDWPRPILPIPHRIRGAEQHGLSVRALRATEYAAVIQGDADTLAARLVAAALLCDGAPAFQRPDQVLLLPERELLDLAVATREALRRIGPTLITSSVIAWEVALVAGCEATENFYDAWSLGGCVDVSWGMGRKAVHVTYHPERWFGVPQRELIDCHWIAYFAAMRMRRKLDSRS